MSISYSTIGWVASVAEGKTADVSYAIKGDSIDKLMGIFNGLGTMVFAYGGHSVVLEIQVINFVDSFCMDTHKLMGMVFDRWAI